MSRVVFALVALVLCGLPPVVFAQAIKLGYVDLQKALNESEAGKREKETFKGEMERTERSLEKRKNDVEKLKEELGFEDACFLNIPNDDDTQPEPVHHQEERQQARRAADGFAPASPGPA